MNLNVLLCIISGSKTLNDPIVPWTENVNKVLLLDFSGRDCCTRKLKVENLDIFSVCVPMRLLAKVQTLSQARRKCNEAKVSVGSIAVQDKRRSV